MRGQHLSSRRSGRSQKEENLATLRQTQITAERETHLNPRSINSHVLYVAQPLPTGPERVRDYYRKDIILLQS